MKDKNKVILDRKNKIESNNLEIISFTELNFEEEIICKCLSCRHEIIGNYRTLSYKKFKCKFCILNSTSELVKNNQIKIVNIEGQNVHVLCKKGHEYKQDRRNLLAGKNCAKCYREGRIFSKEDIQEKILQVHGDYYKYNFDNFKNLHSKIEIKCQKNHIFFQKISNHIQGKGCPICRESIGERIISNYLKKQNINYIRQKKFDDCKYKSKLPFDFYLPEYKIAIEYDGIQHFVPIARFGGVKEFEKTVAKDKIKSEYCDKNQIKLLRISYKDDMFEKLLDIQKLVIF